MTFPMSNENLNMNRVKQYLGGCTQEDGVRRLLSFDMVGTLILGMWLLLQAGVLMFCGEPCVVFLCPLIAGVKLFVVIFAVEGFDNKKPSYFRPYVIYNVASLFIMVIFMFMIDFRKFRPELSFITLMETAVDAISFKVFFVKFVQFIVFWGRFNDAAQYVGAILNILMWVYFTIIARSYYKNLRVQVGGVPSKSDLNSTQPELEAVSTQVPNSTFQSVGNQQSEFSTMQTSAYPQSVVAYSEAPPSYEDVVTNVDVISMYHSFPSLPVVKE